MKKSFVIVLHVAFWICYAILVLIMLGVYYRSVITSSDPGSRVINAFYNVLLFAIVPSFISYWSYYYFLFPNFLQERKVALAIFYGLLISAVASIFAYILLRYFIESGQVVDMDDGGTHGRSTAIRVIIVMTFIASICGSVSLVIKGFITWYNEIKLKELLTEKNHAMEMAMIKSQLDPHLLFNTINNIDALILRDAYAASDYLNKLSDILRFVLYETRAERILLSLEIEYIQKYVALQKIRTSNEGYVDFEVVGIVSNQRVAPMVFIPFIENAFKHTPNKKLEHAIKIKILVEKETIQLLCENKYDAKSVQAANDGGLGNELVQKRLDLIYKGQHTLAVVKKENSYSVNLIIPYE